MMVSIEYNFFQDQISLVLILKVHACIRAGRWLQRVFLPQEEIICRLTSNRRNFFYCIWHTIESLMAAADTIVVVVLTPSSYCHIFQNRQVHLVLSDSFFFQQSCWQETQNLLLPLDLDLLEC